MADTYVVCVFAPLKCVGDWQSLSVSEAEADALR